MECLQHKGSQRLFELVEILFQLTGGDTCWQRRLQIQNPLPQRTDISINELYLGLRID